MMYFRLKKTAAHITSPYGLLRAPWNYNPANYTVSIFTIYVISIADENKEYVLNDHRANERTRKYEQL
jgi:hypothetical protein